MKLFTEQQVKQMLKSTHIHTDNDVAMIMLKFTPIELPTDEETENNTRTETNIFVASYPNHKEIRQYAFAKGFMGGAKWVIEQIKNK